MIPGEEFYPALKKLTEIPEWKVYEQYLEHRQMELMNLFLVAEVSHLPEYQARVNEIKELPDRVHRLIAEVEESHKNRR